MIFAKSSIISISSVILSVFDIYCCAGIGATLLIVLLAYTLIERVKLKPSQSHEKKLSILDIVTSFVGSTFE